MLGYILRRFQIREQSSFKISYTTVLSWQRPFKKKTGRLDVDGLSCQYLAYVRWDQESALHTTLPLHKEGSYCTSRFVCSSGLVGNFLSECVAFDVNFYHTTKTIFGKDQRMPATKYISYPTLRASLTHCIRQWEHIFMSMHVYHCAFFPSRADMLMYFSRNRGGLNKLFLLCRIKIISFCSLKKW